MGHLSPVPSRHSDGESPGLSLSEHGRSECRGRQRSGGGGGGVALHASSVSRTSAEAGCSHRALVRCPQPEHRNAMSLSPSGGGRGASCPAPRRVSDRGGQPCVWASRASRTPAQLRLWRRGRSTQLQCMHTIARGFHVIRTVRISQQLILGTASRSTLHTTRTTRDTKKAVTSLISKVQAASTHTCMVHGMVKSTYCAM